MKKICSFIIAGVMMFGLSTFASAANVSNEAAEPVQEEIALAEQYAYKDLETASALEKEKILAARETIIFSEDWVADGYSGSVQDVVTGEVIKELPTFSEVFPNDWSLPVNTATASSNNAVNEVAEEEFSIMPLSLNSWLRLGSFNHYLQAASDTENAEPFETFTADAYEVGTSVRTYATSLSSSETCNIGYSNASTGVSLGSATNLSLNHAYTIHGVGDMQLSVRASTYSTPGWAVLAIDGAYRVVDLR